MLDQICKKIKETKHYIIIIIYTSYEVRLRRGITHQLCLKYTQVHDEACHLSCELGHELEYDIEHELELELGCT